MGIISSQTHSKTQDVQRDYYLTQKKTLEINPRHPIMKELLRRVEEDIEDPVSKNMALMMLQQTLGVSVDEIEEEEEEEIATEADPSNEVEEEEEEDRSARDEL